MATVRDIARLAGVSIGTVSKALHDNPRISAGTRDRVKRIADQLHYFPNRLAHGVLSGQSRAIGLLVSNIVRPYEASLISGAFAEAEEQDYHVLVREFLFAPDQLRLALMFFIEHRVEGIICAPVYQEPVLLASMTLLKGLDIPVVGVDMRRDGQVTDMVCSDEEQIAATAVEYLMARGHRAIALVGGMPNVRFDTTLGYQVLQALETRGLPALHFGNRPSEQFDDAFARSALEEMRRTHPMPTALICWTDLNAARILQQAPAFHLRVPQDLSILASGDTMVGQYACPPLTCMDLNPARKGCEAVRMLIQRIQCHDADARAPELRVVPCRLIERASCRAPASTRVFSGGVAP